MYDVSYWQKARVAVEVWGKCVGRGFFGWLFFGCQGWFFAGSVSVIYFSHWRKRPSGWPQVFQPLPSERLNPYPYPYCTLTVP